MDRVTQAAGALALALVLAAPRAAADEPRRTSSLGWVRLAGAEGCAGARDLASSVERRLNRPVFVSPARADVLIEGTIQPLREGGFSAHIALSDAAGNRLGTRDLETKSWSCHVLDEQLSLVIALLIDPEAALGPDRPPAAPAPPAQPNVIVQPVYVPVPAAPPPPEKGWEGSLAAGPAVAAGLLPKAGLALFLRGEIVPPSFIPIEVGGAVWLDAHADAAGLPVRGTTLSLAYGLAGLCPLAWASGGTRLRGCAAFEVGAIRAVGYGFSASNATGQEQVVAQTSVEGRVSRRLVGPLSLALGLSVLVPFNRPRFYYVDAAKNEQDLFRASAVAAVVDAGVGLSFP